MSDSETPVGLPVGKSDRGEWDLPGAIPGPQARTYWQGRDFDIQVVEGGSLARELAAQKRDEATGILYAEAKRDRQEAATLKRHAWLLVGLLTLVLILAALGLVLGGDLLLRHSLERPRPALYLSPAG